MVVIRIVRMIWGEALIWDQEFFLKWSFFELIWQLDILASYAPRMSRRGNKSTDNHIENINNTKPLKHGSFRPSPTRPERHIMDRPLGLDKMCLLSVQTRIYILPQSLLWYTHYCLIMDRVITAAYFICKSNTAHSVFLGSRIWQNTCHQTSNISRALVGNEFVDRQDVVGASAAGATPTASSFSI